MPVDVMSEIEIARGRDEVAAYAGDPGNAHDWHGQVESVEWRSLEGVVEGARFAFKGRRLDYRYTVREHVPGERLVIHTADGPFPIETTYSWRPTAGGGTRMTVRSRGEAARFGGMTERMIGAAIRRAHRRDLRRLKRILERRG